MKENKIIWVAVLFADTKFAVTLAKFWLNVAGKKSLLSILNIVVINEAHRSHFQTKKSAWENLSLLKSLDSY